MPKNCSADMVRIVDHIDAVLDGKNETDISRLKDMFGLGELEYGDDFASYVSNVDKS